MASSLTGISIASSYDSLIKVGDNDGLTASLKVISDGLGTESGISLNNAGDLTAIGTITFGSLSDGTITIADIKDEDNMSSNSATSLATQQSIKAYVDSQVSISDLDFAGDTGGTQSINLNTETFTIAGTANEIETVSSGNSLTIGLPSTISGLTSVTSTGFTGELTGNASTASALENPRTINGTSFDGTANISFDTDSVSEGSTNLYLTNARVDARIDLNTGANLDLSSKTTSDLTEGTNLYYTTSRFDSALAGKTTDDVSEGTSNKYFTDERVDDRVSSLVVAGTGISSSYDDTNNSLTITNTSPDQTVALNTGTGINVTGTYPTFTVTNTSPDQTVAITASSGTGLSASGTYPNFTIAGTDASTSAKGVASFSSDHFSVSSGAVSLATDSISDDLIDFGTGTGQVNTDDLPEGSTNQYFTQERSDDAVNNLLTAGTGINLTYNDVANTLQIASTQSGLALTDLSATDAGGDGSFSYDNTSGVFTYTGPSSAEVQAHITKSYVDGLGIAAASATTATSATSADTLSTPRTINGTSFDGSANITFDSDAVAEGATNEYFTNARADARIALQVGSNLDLSSKSTSDLSEGTNLYYTSTRANTDFDTRLATKDTDDVSEGTTNLYYTTGRFDTAFAAKSTTDLSEGTNLYYTTARFDTALGTKTSDDLTQGSSNLYNQTHTGDVTGSVALTIADDAVTGAKIADDTVALTNLEDLKINDTTDVIYSEVLVTVVNPGSGNVYYYDGGYQSITLSKGQTYRFNQSDSTNSGHPLRFSTTSDGTHGGGSEYTTNVTAVGTPGTSGAYTQITTEQDTVTLYTYCTVHSGMGQSVTYGASLDSRGLISQIGLDTNDYINVQADQINFFIDGSEDMRLQDTGTLQVEGDVVAYSTTISSDERLKENVKVIDSPLEKLNEIRGVTFDWIDRDAKSGGVIAQELQKVIPEIVKEVDSINKNDKFLAVDYNGVIGLLIEAVKELNDKCNNCNKDCKNK